MASDPLTTMHTAILAHGSQVSYYCEPPTARYMVEVRMPDPTSAGRCGGTQQQETSLPEVEADWCMGVKLQQQEPRAHKLPGSCWCWQTPQVYTVSKQLQLVLQSLRAPHLPADMASDRLTTMHTAILAHGGQVSCSCEPPAARYMVEVSMPEAASAGRCGGPATRGLTTRNIGRLVHGCQTAATSRHSTQAPGVLLVLSEV